MLTERDIVQMFREGIDCSMIVLAEANTGMTKEEAYRIASCFGAGMFTGGTCGAVTGALMAIGIKHGNHVMNDMPQKEKVLAKRSEFIRRFRDIHVSTDCPVLLGADLRDEEQRRRVRADGIMDKECPKFCITAMRILEEIL